MPRYLTPRQSHSFTARRRKRNIWVTVIIVICVCVLVFALSMLSRAPFLAIKDVSVYGADSSEIPAIQQIVLKSVQGSYLGLFSKSNIATYPRGTVIRNVMSFAPYIKMAAVRIAGLHTLAVTVSERSSAAIVCASLPNWDGNTLQFDPSEPCYASDQGGFIFETASWSDVAHNRYYIPSLANGNPAIIGAFATSSRLFSEWQSLYDGATVNGIRVKAILVKDQGEYELYADNPVIGQTEKAASSTDTVVIYMNSSEPLSLELSSLVSFWTTIVEQAKTKQTSLDFQYIDLRYGSNIYYRLSP